MPQPVGFKAYHLDDNVQSLRDRPDHLMRIGLVAAAWACVERQLIYVFAAGLFFTTHAEKTASTALATIESLSARLDIIGALLKPRIPKELFDEFAVELLPEIRRRSRERNLIVHSHWGVAEEYPEHIIQIRDDDPNDLYQPAEENMIYTTKDLDEIVGRIVACEAKVLAYGDKIGRHVEAENERMWASRRSTKDRG